MTQQTIILDFIPSGVYPVVYATQGDYGLRQIIVKPVNATLSGVSAMLSGTKKDGYGFSYAGEISDGKIFFDVTEQMTIFTGDMLCTVSLANGSGDVVSSSFIMEIRAHALDDDTVISDSDLSLLQQMPSYAEEAKQSASNAEAYAGRAEQILDDKLDRTNDTATWSLNNTPPFDVAVGKTGDDPSEAFGIEVTQSGQTTVNNLINSDGSRNFAYYGEYTSLRDQLNSRYFVNINGLNQQDGHTFVDILSPFFTGYRNIGHGFYWNPPQDTFPGDASSRHEVIFINEPNDKSYSKVIVIWAGGVVIGRCIPLNGVLDHIQWEEGSTQTRLVASLSNTDIYDTTYVSALSGAAYKAGNVVTLSLAFTIVGTTKATVRLNNAGVLPTCHAVGEALRPRCVCRMRSQEPNASTLVAEMMSNQVVFLHNGVPGTYCGTITYISNAL